MGSVYQLYLRLWDVARGASTSTVFAQFVAVTLSSVPDARTDGNNVDVSIVTFTTRCQVGSGAVQVQVMHQPANQTTFQAFEPGEAQCIMVDLPS